MATQSATDGADASIGELISAITDDVRGLVHDEIDLAKAELRDGAKHAGVGVGMIAVAAMLGLLASVLLSVALVYALDAIVLTRGWAYLTVGVFYLALAGVLGLIAKNNFNKVKGPQRTAANAQRAVQVLRQSPRT